MDSKNTIELTGKDDSILDDISRSSTQQTSTNVNSKERKQHIYHRCYYLIRCFIVLLCLSLAFIAVIYSYSSLVTLQATNLLCPIYNADSVYQHNYESGNQHGEYRDSCWRIERTHFNFAASNQLDFDVYTAFIDNDQKFGTIVVCIIYALLGVFLSLIGIKNAIYTASDFLLFILYKSYESACSKSTKYVQW